MARSSNALPFVTLGVVVVCAAFGVGYYVLGGPRSTPAPTVEPRIAPSPTPAPVKDIAPRVTVRTKNSNYTAPGAPPIQITEDATPTVKRRTTPAAPALDTSHDPEASQEGAPPPPPVDNSHADTGQTPADNSSPSDTNNALPADTSPAPSAPADPDYEQPGGKMNSANTSDPEASQQAPKATFRVQTGSFAAPQNAKALADALRQRGYITSTRSEQDGGRTVYKVQIGAYRSKAAADKAALDLQKDGYPAYSSPIGP